MNTYYESVIELKVSMTKRELLIFPVFCHLFYFVRGSHVKESCQLCTSFFVKDTLAADFW